MDIGLVQVFGLSPKYGFDYLGRFARTAERLGFESIWLPEHVAFFSSYESVYPYPPEPGSDEEPQLPVGGRPAIFDPLLAGQAVALHTSTVRVGTAIALVALRHPLLWARAAGHARPRQRGPLRARGRRRLDARGVRRARRAVRRAGSVTDEYLDVAAPAVDRGRDDVRRPARPAHRRAELPQAGAAAGAADPHRGRERRRAAAGRPVRRRLVRLEHDAGRAGGPPAAPRRPPRPGALRRRPSARPRRDPDPGRSALAAVVRRAGRADRRLRRAGRDPGDDRRGGAARRARGPPRRAGRRARHRRSPPDPSGQCLVLRRRRAWRSRASSTSRSISSG